MSYNKTEVLTTIAYCVILFLLCSIVGYTQVNAITEDETGVSIQPVPPVDLTIVFETGQPTVFIPGDVKGSKYDVKSIPMIHQGHMIRIDSIVLRDDSGLIKKHMYITSM